MTKAKLIKFSAACAVSFLAFSAAPAQTPEFALLQGLQLGEWTLSSRGASTPGEKVCLGDPTLLLQIQHRSVSCSRYVIENSPKKLRVSYRCGEQGHGVTEIKRESSSLVQIHSQGIESNAPFSFSVEGRRTGSC